MQQWICVICGFIYDGEGPRFASIARGGAERPAMDGRAGSEFMRRRRAREGDTNVAATL